MTKSTQSKINYEKPPQECKLSLKILREEDIQFVVDIFNEPLISKRLLREPKKMSIEEIREKISSKEIITAYITYLKNVRLGLLLIRRVTGKPFLVHAIKDSLMRGRGYGRLALKCFFKLHEIQTILPIYAKVHLCNEKSAGSLLACGFVVLKRDHESMTLIFSGK